MLVVRSEMLVVRSGMLVVRSGMLVVRSEVLVVSSEMLVVDLADAHGGIGAARDLVSHRSPVSSKRSARAARQPRFDCRLLNVGAGLPKTGERVLVTRSAERSRTAGAHDGAALVFG